MKRLFATLLTLLLAAPFGSAAPPELQMQHRRPAASVLLNHGRILCVANRRSGTLSLVDLARRKVTEQQIGQQLSDVAVLSGSDELLVSDFAGGSVIVLRHVAGRVEVTNRVEVAAWPESIAVNDQGSLVCVASLWSRRLTILTSRQALNGDHAIVAAACQIDLPFAPHTVEFVDTSHAVLTDAFGGKLVVVDCVAGKVTAQHELSVHNIRDMTVGDDRRLYLTCQRRWHDHH